MNKSIVLIIIAIVAVLAGGYFFMSGQKGSTVVATDTSGTTVQTAWVEITNDPVYLDTAEGKTKLQSGDTVSVGAVIETGQTGTATIHFPDASLARMDVNTTLTLSALSFNQNNNSLIVGIGLTIGRVWSKVVGLATPESSWEVKTSNTVATVRGTAFGVGYKKDGTSWVLGSEHTIAVAPLDPKTKKKIASAEVPLGESSLIQLNDTDAAIAGAAIGSTTITAKISPVTKEFKTNAWILADQAADKDFNAKVDALRAQGADDAAVRDALRTQDTDVQKQFRDKREPAPAVTSPGTPNTPAAPGTGSQTNTAPTTGVTNTSSGTSLPAPTKANTNIAASRALDKLVEDNIVQFSAIIDVPTGVQDITTKVVWHVVGSIGSITPAGLFTALLGADVSEFGQGTGYVTATLPNGDVIQSASIRVQAKVPTNLGTQG